MENRAAPRTAALPAGATAPARRKARKPSERSDQDRHLSARRLREMNKARAPGGTQSVAAWRTGPRSGPAGATAPARRKARKPSERSERPAPEAN